MVKGAHTSPKTLATHNFVGTALPSLERQHRQRGVLGLQNARSTAAFGSVLTVLERTTAFAVVCTTPRKLSTPRILAILHRLLLLRRHLKGLNKLFQIADSTVSLVGLVQRCCAKTVPSGGPIGLTER
jgi:hypothetical protein